MSLAPKKLFDKKIYQLSLIENNGLLVMLSGKERLIQIKSLEGLLTDLQSSLDSKIRETKHATSFAINSLSLTLCVAIKNRLLFYKIHAHPRPYIYTLVHEFNVNQDLTYLEISILKINDIDEEILWYGYSSTFMAQRIDQQCPSVVLLRDTDPTLQAFRELSIGIVRVIHVKS